MDSSSSSDSPSEYGLDGAQMDYLTMPLEFNNLKSMMGETLREIQSLTKNNTDLRTSIKSRPIHKSCTSESLGLMASKLSFKEKTQNFLDKMRHRSG